MKHTRFVRLTAEIALTAAVISFLTAAKMDSIPLAIFSLCTICYAIGVMTSRGIPMCAKDALSSYELVTMRPLILFVVGVTAYVTYGLTWDIRWTVTHSDIQTVLFACIVTGWIGACSILLAYWYAHTIYWEVGQFRGATGNLHSV